MSITLPEGLQMRPPVKADIENMSELLKEYALAYTGESDFTLEDLRTLWDSPTFDMSEQVRLVVDATGRLLYAVYIDQRSYVRYNISLDVLPGHEDARVRAALLAWCEEWARQQMVKAPAEARTYLMAGVPAKDEAANGWFRVQPDFHEKRRYWEMQIEMHAAPPVPLWPEGISLRPFVVEHDARAVFEADEEVFSDHWGHLPQDYPTWRHWTVERADFDPSLWFIAYAGEQIAGISLCKDDERAWLDTLGVTRAWRGKGLGLALLHHTFGEFYRRSKLKVGLGVDSQNLTGATRLYERAGMHVAHEYISYEKELRAGVELSTQELAV